MDESEAREALLQAAGNVSQQKVEEIKALPSYLFKSYRRRVLRLLTSQKHYASLESINEELSSDMSVAEVMEQNLLVGEIVARMDSEIRTIYEGLILGYSFEEIARKIGKNSNYLRSKFSKGVNRIARDIRPAVK